MDQTTSESPTPAELLHALRKHSRLWILPAVICTVIAAGYALIATRRWQATQALIVRPAAASISEQRLGKFSDLSEMKTLQETILELAMSQHVIVAALQEVGPPRHYRKLNQWPTLKDVELFRQQVKMTPPGGAEFGKTEIFYLSVHDPDRQRAIRLVSQLCDQLESRMKKLRDQRGQGMVSELERTVSMTQSDLDKNTDKLTVFESAIGADLAELRNLSNIVGGQSDLAEELQTIEAERRAIETEWHEHIQLLALLKAAHADPQQILATPNSLLQSQPALSRIKNALVDAQVYTASLLGNRAEVHPYVLAAKEAEARIRHQLHEEITSAIIGVEIDLGLATEHENSLRSKWEAGRERLARLAAARAKYTNLVASVDNHSKLLESASKNLADARANLAGAQSASVISRIDGVETGTRPVGPGRTTITAAGGIGGLILGLGLVFLVAGPEPAFSSAREKGVANGHTNNLASDSFGMFHGMPLDEVIRNVEK